MQSSTDPLMLERTGRLHGATVPELLWHLTRTRATGRLHLHRAGTTKSVVLEDGRILFAGSDDNDERLGEMLIRDGLITVTQLEAASGTLAPGRRLGTALIEQNALSPDDLVKSVLAQVRSILFGLIDWEEGDWRFESGPPAIGQGIQLGVSSAQLILEGTRQIRSFSLLRKIVGMPKTWYRPADGADRLPSGMSLSEGEKLVLDAVTRRPRSVESLCDELVLSSFEVHQALAAFRVLGIATAGASDSAKAAGGAARGSLDRSDFLSVLVELCRAGETGVLRVVRGSVERTFHVRQGGCVFATSNDADDGLVSHLFRRGVISLRDREEVCRRLLTNKRVGTLLMEMGVLDQADLARAVRSQIKSILLDSARWQDGEYWFAAGELPTVEEIVLDESLENLVLAAARTVSSWTQVIRGVGGLDARLVVAPGYLEALDRMTVGSDEWDLVAALTEPRTVRDVCRASSMGDFRSAQTLWALKTLGVITESHVPAADTAKAEPAASDTRADKPQSTVATTPAVPAPVSEKRDQAGEAGVPTGARTLGAETHHDSPATKGFELVTRPSALEPAIRADVARAEAAPALELAAPGTGLPDSASAPSAVVGGARVRDIQQVEPEPAKLVATTIVQDTVQADLVARIENAVAEPTPEPPAAVAASEPRSTVEAAAPAEAEATSRDSVVDRSAAFEPAKEPERSVSAEASATAAALVEPPAVAEAPAQTVSESARAEEPQAEEEDLEPIDPELARQIERFNNCQQIVYRTVRAEVGAGASNFVRFCGLRLGDGFDELFARVDLMDDGTWDPAGLRRAVRKARVVDPWLGFQRLIEKEIEMVQVHLGAGQAGVLRRRLEEFDRADATL